MLEKFRYKNAVTRSCNDYVNGVKDILLEFEVAVDRSSCTDPVGLLSEEKRLNDVCKSLHDYVPMSFSNSSMSELNKYYKDAIEEHDKAINDCKDEYARKIQDVKDSKESKIKSIESSIESYKSVTKSAFESRLQNHTLLNSKRSEIEDLMRIYDIDCSVYDSNFDIREVDDIDKSSKVALESYKTITCNPRLIHKVVQLAYLPLVVKLKEDYQQKILLAVWTVAFMLFCFFMGPITLGVISICYFADYVFNLFNRGEKVRIIQMVYSMCGDINIEELVEDTPKYYELCAQLDEARDVDIEPEIKKLESELEKKLKELDGDTPSADKDEATAQLTNYMMSKEYENIRASARKSIDEFKKGRISIVEDSIREVAEIKQRLIDSVKTLGTEITMSESMLDKLKVGCLYDMNGIPIVESSVDIGARNTIFKYSTEEGKQDTIDFMKLLLANYLCNIREKHLTVSIYDSDGLGKDFVEFFSNDEMKHYIKVYEKELGKKIASVANDLMVRYKKMDSSDIGKYNEESQKVGKITIDYELVIILSSELNYVTDKQLTSFMDYSDKKGIIFWVLTPDPSIIVDKIIKEGTEKFIGNNIVSPSYGDIEIDGENVIQIPNGYSPYKYGSSLGRKVIKLFIDNMNDEDRHQNALLYSDFRKKYIPDDKVWTGSTNDGIDILFGLQDGDPEKPFTYELGDSPVHALMGGATGSGKSAAINQFLANLLLTYSPEELELVMVDFKNIEFKRYTGKNSIPHAKIIAGTKDGEYAISIFDYLVGELNRRTKVFGTRQVEKLSEWNKLMRAEGTPEKCMPRILVLIDEFQTMFTDVDEKSVEKIKAKIVSLTRLARFCGCHLFFTSQSMKGTMSKDIQDNFGLRAALKCTKDVSQSIIGNSAAGTIKEKHGWIYINDTIGQDATANRLYRIPFISTPDIDDYIALLHKKCKQEGHIDRKAVYYDEDDKYYEKDLLAMLDKYSDIKDNKSAFILGERTEFSTNEFPNNFVIDKAYDENVLIDTFERKEQCDMVSTFITQFREKGIPFIVHCPDNELVDIMDLKNKVDEKYQAFLSDSIPNEALVESLEDALDYRKKNPKECETPMFFIGIDWENVNGLGRAEDSRLVERLMTVLHEAPKYNYHFILSVRRFAGKRMWKPYFKNYICSQGDENESMFMLDNMRAKKLNKGFAIYKYGSLEQKFKIYQFKYTKEFKNRELKSIA